MPSTAPEVRRIHVMVGAVADAAGRILVARRPDHVHQGGLWELPGGKLEPGEHPAAGLRRELREELGIDVRSSRPLIRVGHDYGDRHVLLDVHRVERYSGTPFGREGQPLDWLDPAEMDPDAFPAADRPIITALRLPATMLITGRDPRHPDVFLARLERALAEGVRLVQLRAGALPDEGYVEIASRAYDLCQRHAARLVLNRDPAALPAAPRHGLHLGSRALMQLEQRPGEAGDLVGASCHDARELGRAVALGLDYALLSPVKRTESHPEATPMGWRGFAELVDPVPLPVFALGGLSRADLADAFAHGAQGIAAIRGLWPTRPSAG